MKSSFGLRRSEWLLSHQLWLFGGPSFFIKSSFSQFVTLAQAFNSAYNTRHFMTSSRRFTSSNPTTLTQPRSVLLVFQGNRRCK